MAQPRGRFEWVEGEVVAMAPERAGHALLKALVWRALFDAVRKAGVPCQTFPDGVTVQVGEHTDYEPDVVVNCGDRMSLDALAAPSPVIVVEVLSPSTASVDTTRKLPDYFSLSSIRHYLVVRPDKPLITHHVRQEDGAILTRIVVSGELRLDPPGISISIEEIYRDAGLA